MLLQWKFEVGIQITLLIKTSVRPVVYAYFIYVPLKF